MLRPIDLTVLAYLTTGPTEWTQTSVARALRISQSNVHRSLNQLRDSELLSADQKPLVRPFRDLLVYTVRHVYPVKLGPPARGVPTATSAPMLTDMVRSNDNLVWPNDRGSKLGTSVTPLHNQVPLAALESPNFYEIMALIDVFRLGRIRECREAQIRLDTLLAVCT